MGRPRRRFPNDSVLHVVNRGNDRRTLFASPANYREFSTLLWSLEAEQPIRIVAYVIMPNHWHLVVWPHTTNDLWRFLQRLTGTHAQRLRRQSSTVGQGHMYQGRYRAFHVDTFERYVKTIRYVEANPLRSGLVAKAEDWIWSSLHDRCIGRPPAGPDWLPLPPLPDWITLVNASCLAVNQRRQVETPRKTQAIGA
jgi:putative transposase